MLISVPSPIHCFRNADRASSKGKHTNLPTVNMLIRHRGHYNAWKLLTSSFPVRIEMLRLMNKMSAKILNFWIRWHTVYAIYFAGVLVSRISRVGCYSRIQQQAKINLPPIPTQECDLCIRPKKKNSYVALTRPKFENWVGRSGFFFFF